MTCISNAATSHADLKTATVLCVHDNGAAATLLNVRASIVHAPSPTERPMMALQIATKETRAPAGHCENPRNHQGRAARRSNSRQTRNLSAAGALGNGHARDTCHLH